MSKALLLNAAASGAAGGAVTYVEDVFSTYLYDGTSSSQTITNGIDLSGEGGMVWLKGRSNGTDGNLYDTARGVRKYIKTNSVTGQSTANSGAGLTSFNNNGFTLGNNWNTENFNGYTYASWTFRKAEKFFDIVTYTGDGTTGRSIAHNLGSVPGMIWIKNLTGEPWVVYHRGIGNTKSLRLDVNHAADMSSAYWNNTNPTSTHFTLGNGGGPRNESGVSYVAYLFGHNEAVYGENSDEAIIYCDSFTTTPTWGSFRANIGFEPQWILVKRTDSTSDWMVLDTMRGSGSVGDQTLVDTLFSNDSDDQELKANDDAAESAQGRGGFYSKGYIGSLGGAGNATYIYMAIRRPNKPASEFTASQVFHQQALSAGEGTDTFVSTGFPVDALIYAKTNAGAPKIFGSKLTGGRKLGGEFLTDSNDAQGTNTGAFFLDHNTGVTVDHAGGHFQLGPSATDTAYVRYFFRRVPGFFDVVTYVSNTTYPNTFAHNLGVVPELVILKRRDGSSAWAVYSSATGNDKHLVLSTNAGAQSSSSYWNTTTPTSTVVHVGGQDETWGYNGYKYIAILFATVPGISKVGSYTGSDTDQTIDCGFSNGARFILIKRTDSTGDWYVLDSVRGLSTGSDPYFKLNTTDAQSTGNMINVRSSGFGVSSGAGSNGNSTININNASYIFLAIA